MKRTLLLCGLSALVGTATTLLWIERPYWQAVSEAQEPAAWSGPPAVTPRTEIRAYAPPLTSPGLPGSAPPVALPLVAPPSASPPTMPLTISGLSLPANAVAEELTPEERVNVAVYHNVNRCVVNINTKTIQPTGFALFESTSEGEGSGTILDRSGHILTNFHVIDGSREIQVTLADGKSYEARLVGVDPATDVAVLKIEAPPDSLSPITFGNSTNLLVGQKVYALGNPFGLERTLTTGIISSLNRSLPARRTGRSIKSIIQIDAAMNPGNSGGPLLDSRGRMIGMNTAIASRTGESAGVGFAIPVNTIARVVPQLIERGKVIRPDSGIGRVYQTDRGLLIATLVPGGAAEKAGLQGPRIVKQKKRQGPFVYETQTVDRSAADLIVAVDGQPVRTADDFLTAIDAKRPGDEAILTVVRDGQQRQVPLRLDAGE